MSDYYVVESQSLSDVADAIREKTGNNTPLEFPDDFVSEIGNISGGGDESEYWTRPSSWPDLDSLDFTDFEGYYLTYKLDEVDEPLRWISVVTTTDSGDYIVERGHITNGVFVVDYSQDVTRNTVFREQLSPSNGNIQLWRVIPKTGHLTCGGVFNARPGANDYFSAGLQPCVEQYSKGTYMTTTNLNNPAVAIDGYGRLAHVTFYLQHDRIIGQTAYTNINNFIWRQSIALRLLDFEDASFPSVTSIAQAFVESNIEKIDFSGVDLSNVTNCQLAFNCRTIKYLDFSTVGNVTTFNRIIENNNAIVELFPPSVIAADFPIATLSRLSQASVARIIDALALTTETLTITLSNSVKAALSQEQIATITGKGWTIA